MITKLYTVRNVLSVAFHYAVAGAVMAGSVMLAPLWAVGAGAVLIGGVAYLSIKLQKELMENHLVRHPDVHAFSPSLGKITQDLYKKSGLSVKDNPVYGFRVDKEKIRQRGAFYQAIAKVLTKVGDTHNAAAVRLSKPVIMISEPLLKLLDDAEEKAVLAHEFAHAVAHHSRIGLPQRLILGVSASANVLTTFAAALATGWVGVMSALGGQAVSKLLFHAARNKTGLLSQKDDLLSPKDLVEKKKVLGQQKVFTAVVTTSILTYFAPVYLGIYAAAKGMLLTGKVFSGTLSRSMEYQADRGAVVLGANPLALITSLRKMTIIQERARKLLFKGADMPKAGWLSESWKKAQSTHPTLENRMGRLAKIAREKGFTGAEIDAAVKGNIAVSADNNMPFHVINTLLRQT